MIFDKLFKKKEEEFAPTPLRTELPTELERFRLREPTPAFPPRTRDEEFREFARAPPVAPAYPERPREEFRGDKIELILQKLETIDARLKFIEERLARVYR